MKELSELNLPTDCRYTKDHEWIRKDGDTMQAGIDDYAQDQLGEVVFVELPEVGAVFRQGDEFGTVESVKAVSELYMPVDGEVAAVNVSLTDAPEKVNQSPYEDGWMIRIQPVDPEQFATLMDAPAYLKYLEGLD